MDTASDWYRVLETLETSIDCYRSARDKGRFVGALSHFYSTALIFTDHMTQ